MRAPNRPACSLFSLVPGFQIHSASLRSDALSEDPSLPSAHYNLGVLQSERGDDDSALSSYQSALDLHPKYAEALCNTGVIRRKQGRLGDALSAHEACFRCIPTSSIARESYATALSERAASMCLNSEGSYEEQMQMHRRAISLAPTQTRCLFNAAVASSMQSANKDMTAFLYFSVVHNDPSCGQAWNALGNIRRQELDVHTALHCYSKACEADAADVSARNNLGVLLALQGRCIEAENVLLVACRIDSLDSEAYNNLGVLYRDMGESERSLQAYRDCLRRDRDARAAGQNILLQLNYVMGGERQEVCTAHRRWGERFEQLHPRMKRSPRSPGAAITRRLRVGYLSPDLCVHSVSYFAEAPLREHSPSHVDIFVYSCTGKPDERTKYLKELAEQNCNALWRDCAQMSESEIAQQVDRDEVDILVELTGHTASNRLGVMAQKPTPVQVTWIGYPNSTGLSSVDYRITDAVCDPQTTSQEFTEELVRLNPCFLCYTPPRDYKWFTVSSLPAKSRGYVTFGSFNALAKTRDEVLQCWASILHRVPESRLVLKAKAFAETEMRDKYLRRAERNGIPPHRLDLFPLVAETRYHLEAYNQIDIALDSFPYAGTTTTCESLLMGVPCVTLAGSCHAHNVGSSLLQAAGLADWVATSDEEYIALAIEAAGKLESLEQLRSQLRDKLLSSTLCDASRFVEQLEELYKWMVNTEQLCEKPESSSEEHTESVEPFDDVS